MRLGEAKLLGRVLALHQAAVLAHLLVDGRLLLLEPGAVDRQPSLALLRGLGVRHDARHAVRAALPRHTHAKGARLQPAARGANADLHVSGANADKHGGEGDAEIKKEDAEGFGTGVEF